MIQMNSDGSYTATQQGALRLIVVEGDTRHDALLACVEVVHEQEAEDYALEQAETALSLE